MPSLTPIFEWSEWTFEPAEWRLVRATAVVPLPNKSLELLALLLDRAPGLVSKDEILGTVWRDAVVEEGNIAFHIAILRKTLDGEGGASCIETVRGRGYRFVAPVARREAAHPAARAQALAQPEPPRVDLRPRVEQPAPPVSGAVPTPARAARSRAAQMWPVLLVAGAASLMGWLALSTDEAVREVAVVPVRVVGEDTALDGVAEAIVARVSGNRLLSARIAAAGDPAETAVEAGRRVQAATVLTATVDRSRNPWRVAVQLTRTRDARRIWDWVFEVPAGAPDARSAVAARVAAGLGRHLGVAVQEPAPGTKNAEAFDLFLRGREAWRLRTPHSVQQAIALYERALAIDPSFARAYAGLADCYNLTMSGLPVEVRYPQAKAYAERALELDPGLAEGHTSLAFLRYKFEWRWQDAESGFKRAIDADPSYALAHHWYGEFLGVMGRYDEASAELKRALELEPDSLAIQSDLVPPLLRAGRIAEARAVVESAAAANPNWHWIPRRMSEVLAAEGRERESLEEYWRALVLSGATLDSVEALRAAYRTGGLPAVLRLEIARLEAAEAASPGAPMVATDLSRAHARLGERAAALRWVRIALDRREDAAILLLQLPEYDSLRGDPAFEQLLERVGLKGRN